MRHNNRKNTLWVLLLAVCLLLGGMPVTAWAAETEAVAVPADAIYLSTPEDILELAENCVSDAWSRDKVFVLSGDIDLSGTSFTGIPTFGGTLLGQGYTVSGLYLHAQQNAQGFFRYLQTSAVVENLHLKGTVRPEKSNNLDIGGLAGVNSGTVRNCSFTGSVSGTERVGGIAGRNRISGMIENCTVSGTVYGDHYIGGITGENLGVLRGCENRAEVNTHVDHNSVSAGLSISSFTEKESTSDATNIGGIAGTSSGVIRGCENHAAIGYEKMGYNVGGIAGSQIGYIAECSNYGVINGSNGVGGIVGQFKPNVVLNMGENYMSELTDEMIGMMSTLSGMMGSMQSMMGNVSANMENIEESMDMLKDPENWDPDSLRAAVNEMSSSFNGMYQDMVASGSKMTGQMGAMMGSMSGMVETMEKLNEGLNIKIVDISKEDTLENTVAKASDCANFAPVYGETYVGGIAGIADIEDTTAQSDITGQLNFSSEGEMIMRLVIRDCRNTGTVSASKQYAGGIVGNMVLGAVIHGMNTGSIDSLSADYVGGIAGNSESYIQGSFSRCVLAGNRYVGGIAGFGAETVGCYAITDIAAATKFAGGILGYAVALPDEETGLILDNHYYLTDAKLGGIDGICYEGATAPMTVTEFLSSEGIDDMFRTVEVRFVSAQQEDIVLTVNLGKTLPVAKIPQLDVQDNEQYHWVLRENVTSQTLAMGETPQMNFISRERLSKLLFDQTYDAVFDAKSMVIESEEKHSSGRPLALAAGAFDQDATLRLSNITNRESEINGIEVQENWQVTIADPGIEQLHYRMPETIDAENTTLYVKDSSGNWVRRDFRVEGSYMIFPFGPGETRFALQVQPDGNIPAVAVVIAAAAALLTLFAGLRSRKRKAGRKGTAGEEN